MYMQYARDMLKIYVRNDIYDIMEYVWNAHSCIYICVYIYTYLSLSLYIYMYAQSCMEYAWTMRGICMGYERCVEYE